MFREPIRFLIITSVCSFMFLAGSADARVKVSPDDNILHWDTVIGYYGNNNIPATAHVWSGSEWQPAVKYRYAPPADDTKPPDWQRGNAAWTGHPFMEGINMLLLHDAYPARPDFKSVSVQGDAQECGATIDCDNTVVHDIMVNYVTGQANVSLSCSDQPLVWAGQQTFSLGVVGLRGAVVFMLHSATDIPVMEYAVSVDLSHPQGVMVCVVYMGITAP